MSKFKVGNRVQLISVYDDNEDPGIVSRIDTDGVYVIWVGNDSELWHEDSELRWLGPTDMTFDEVLEFLRNNDCCTGAYLLEQENITRRILQDPDYQLYLQLHERYKGVNNG